MNASKSLPTHLIWQGLLDGDPGPAVAFFESLLAADCSFAAGGLARDVAVRIHDVHEFVDDAQGQALFVTAAREFVAYCLGSDAVAADRWIAEVGQQET